MTKSLEFSVISSRYEPSNDEESQEDEMVQSGSSPLGGGPRLRRHTRGLARQQELETQLEGMDITDEEEVIHQGVDQDMQDVESTASRQSNSPADEEDEEGDGDDEAEEFGKLPFVSRPKSLSDLLNRTRVDRCYSHDAESATQGSSHQDV
ncbi:hypothetical protein QFC19_008768 [Naganishia cerealis]|uniref:Uncharacterized protein n=1 Tax=Naganishia cerealis TaxID=610337 RepID=A0ACC2V0J1_9TREE|nr:hypothetical protein QFC19_008768 [Naganishia cerealis]